MCIYSQVIHLTERLNRAGVALTDQEADWLDEALRLEAATKGESRKRGPAKKFWTPREEQRLRRSLAKGLGVPQIAPTLKRTPEAVRSKIQVMGLSVRAAQG